MIACIIMEKGTPTKQIVFHQGYFKDEDKGKSNKKMYVKEYIQTFVKIDIEISKLNYNSDNDLDNLIF